jgi:hypothetical protein
VSRTAGASGAKKRAASRGLKATRVPASRTAEASGAKRRAASSQLEATRVPARRMVAGGAASTWAAPRELLVAAHSAARRMAGASAASKTAAPSQSFEVLVPCTAASVSGMRSPMMHSRPHCNSSLVMCRRLELPLGSRTTCEDSRRADGGWRASAAQSTG